MPTRFLQVEFEHWHIENARHSTFWQGTGGPVNPEYTKTFMQTFQNKLKAIPWHTFKASLNYNLNLVND